MAKKSITGKEKVESKGKSKQEKVKFSIKVKLLLSLLSVLIIVLVSLLTLIYNSTSNIVLKKSENLLKESTGSVVNKIDGWVGETLASLNLERDAIEFFTMDETAELEYIKHTANKHDAYPAGIYFATKEGRVVHSSFVPGADYNVYEKTWYKDGLLNEKFALGSVEYDENSKSYVVGASAMLRDKAGVVRGVAATDIYLDAISKIISDVQLEKTGAMFLVDGKTNTVIGHKSADVVGKALSEQANPMYKYVAEQLGAGKTGLITYKGSDGLITYLDIRAVASSSWSAVAYVPKAEVMSDLNALIKVIAMLAVVAIILLFALITVLVGRIVDRPVREIDHVARSIAEGKLDESIGYKSNDEFGALAINFNKTVSRLRNYVQYIDEISAVLEEIANGNLDFHLVHEYVGEFTKVKNSLYHISDSLNNTLGQINIASEQVNSGSDQVSSGAQALSQGATEQASSIEELAATINEVSTHIKQNAINADSAKKVSVQVSEEILHSNSKMGDMTNAIEDISSKSKEINKIIKTIEDISFQTNILALNAAVEAARAGSAGKGFAVVADEVRNLANKSSAAAKNTTVLIEETVKAVENGTLIASDTAKSLLAVVANTQKVTALVEDIAQASEAQALSMEQISLGIEQVSAVVQTNSATSEESAAASQELLGQAQMLKGLVGQFILKDDK